MITVWFRPYRAVVLFFILAAFVLRIPILKVRYFDPDEFQHLHGARQIYHGEIPYRDYFEHHTPFLHFILAGFYPIFGEEIRILFAARALMMAFTAAILYLTYVLTKTLYKTDAGLFAALFLSYVVMFLEKTIEVRPDVPAVTFWLASLIFMVKGIQRNAASSSPQPTTEKEGRGDSPRPCVPASPHLPILRASVVSSSSSLWFIFSGLMVGMAVMFTQKALFALGGLLITLMWMLFDRRTGTPRKRSLKLAAVFLGSTMVPIILTLLFFHANGGLWQFIDYNFIMNSRWKAKFWPFNYIKRMLGQNPFFPIIGIFGLFMATLSWILDTRYWMLDSGIEHRVSSIQHQVSSIKHRASGSFAPVLCTYALIAGLFIMPVPHRQYYLLFLPLLAVYCGLIFKKITEVDILRLISDIRDRKPRPISVGLTILALNLVIAGLMYTLRLGKPAVLDSRILYLILWICLVVFAVPAFILKKSAYTALIISIGIIAYPLDQTVDQLSKKNSNQLANVKYIMDITSEEDTVLGGWSGFGFLRSHAYYYFFLHGQMRAMLSEKERSDDLIESLEEKHTKVVIYDSSIKALPEKVQKYISANYVPSGHGNIYVRK